MRGPASNTSPTAQCIELARRRLLQLTEQNNKQQAEVLAEVQQRLDHADAIRPNDPKQAASIYRAAIELYGHRRWADPIVHRAQQALDQLKTDSHPSVNASQ
jgi:cytidylate kinase